MKVGVFLLRAQPIQDAHLWVIEQIAKENDEVCVIIGSANKYGTLRNPLNIELRREMVIEALSKKSFYNKVKVHVLPDWLTEENTLEIKEWGRFLYYNIVAWTESKTFNYYYCDESKIVLTWFDEYILDRITFKFFERSKLFDGLSSTKIRESFINENIDYIKKYCPESVVNRYDLIREVLLKINDNPANDIIMR